VRVGVAGEAVRLRLSNLFGQEPLAVESLHVAVHQGGDGIAAGSDRRVQLGGAASFSIAPGASVLSDPVVLPVKALGALAVSLYLPAGAKVSTLHGNAIQTAYLVEGRDASGEASLPGAATDDSRYFLTDVEILASGGGGALAVVGDSIADGIGSTLDRNARWPDILSERMQGLVAVVNAGIAGNRLLGDSGLPYVGPATLSRFDRDALDKPGVRRIILMQGINDISAAELLAAPKDKVSAQQIIDGMKTLIARAHARGVKIWGGTLLPCAGATRPLPASAAMEAKRQQVNRWIRTAGAFDGVIDFDAALRDPADHVRLSPAFDSGDHLHPNDAGYRAMAQAVDLERLLNE
jgi:lysophospholipase L1-like esterase